MPGVIEAAGAVKNPSRYATLTQNARDFTGLWTQRSPYRDAAVPFLVAKFYGGSRFDSILDGVNREISQSLTDVRSPGHIPYNSIPFPPALSFYSYKQILNSQQTIRVLLDGNDGNIYDATAGQSSVLMSKASDTAPARFLGLTTRLQVYDGNKPRKWLTPGPWTASTAVAPGTLISVGAEPGVLQMALGGITVPIIASQSNGSATFLYVDPQQIPLNFTNLVGVTMTFAGLGAASYLNATSHPVAAIISTTLGILEVNVSHTAYPYTAENGGTGTTGNGTTGATAPTFSTTQFGITADAGQQWKCYGSAVENLGLATPVGAPNVFPPPGTGGHPARSRWWMPQTALTAWYSIIDLAGNIEAVVTAGTTGRIYPTFATSPGVPPVGQTNDGTVVWNNFGQIAVWAAGATYVAYQAVILDSNGNLQGCTTGGAAGGTAPSWASTVGTTTIDGSVTWTCLGPGSVYTTGTVSYAYSTHAVDGSVSTASALFTIFGGIIGAANPLSNALITGYVEMLGSFDPTDKQIDQIWIWRTAQNESTLILEDQFPADLATMGDFVYFDVGVPDTSIAGGGALNALIPAPVADSNDPPLPSTTAPVFHLQRVFAILNNTVVWSGGPDTITGNGTTAFPPLNFIPFVAQPIRLEPVTVENGGILVFTNGDGMWIILGDGTSGNPFQAWRYFGSVHITGYNAVSMYNNAAYLMESNGKVSQVAVQYPFNPQTGYSEVGFPIGDQFVKVTTGNGYGALGALYNPATAFVSWCMANSMDTGLYVADGAVGWFRMSMIQPPESGLLWSPRRVIANGTSAVQSIEIAPGMHRLLLGNSNNGIIWMRDPTGESYNDPVGYSEEYQAYPSWDAKGVTLLCSSGQWAELAHIAAKSLAVGNPPVVSTLMGEIVPMPPERPWNALDVTSNDPPDTPESLSVFSHRYALAQNNEAYTSDCILVKFDYGEQTVGDALLDWGIYASVHDERSEEAAPAK
jgi:hypothetical protein